MYAVKLDRWLGHDGRGLRAEPGRRAAPGRCPRRAARRPPAAARAGRRGPAPAPRPRRGRRPVRPRATWSRNVEREALKLAVQRPALCGPVFDALGAGVVHRAGAPGGVRADRGLRRRPGRRTAASEWMERLRAAAPDDRIADFLTQLARASRSAPRAATASRTPGTPTRPGPGRGAGGEQADRGDQGPAAAHQPGRRAGRSTTGCSVTWWRWSSRHRALSEQVSDSI